MVNSIAKNWIAMGNFLDYLIPQSSVKSCNVSIQSNIGQAYYNSVV